jgi:hypothetical protein
MVGVQRRSLVILVVTSFATLFFAILGAAEAQQEQYDGANPAQQDLTTTQDTTIEDSIDQAAQDAQASNDRSQNSDSFQCVSFLRVVRDENGALRRQYLNDDLIVQRFEQCLSGEVLADTIPNRYLPYTGGVPLLGLAAIGLASLVAGASVLRTATRRRR